MKDNFEDFKKALLNNLEKVFKIPKEVLELKFIVSPSLSALHMKELQKKQEEMKKVFQPVYDKIYKDWLKSIEKEKL